MLVTEIAGHLIVQMREKGKNATSGPTKHFNLLMLFSFISLKHFGNMELKVCRLL